MRPLVKRKTKHIGITQESPPEHANLNQVWTATTVIDLVPNGIQFGAKSNGNVQLNSDFVRINKIRKAI